MNVSRELSESLPSTTLPVYEVPYSQAFYDGLQETLNTYPNPSVAYRDLGANYFRMLIEHASPVLAEVLKRGKSDMDGPVGSFVLRNALVQDIEPDLAELIAIASTSFYGSPTTSSPMDSRLAWPVRVNDYSGSNRTFSQTNEEATLHTDTQYYPDPEPYFGLFCVAPDQNGDGTSSVVRLEDAVGILVENNGSDALDELSKPYPFRVPAVFTKTGEETDIEITWAPILKNGRVRYRLDTLLSALDLPDIEITSAQKSALEAFNGALNSAPKHIHHLKAGEAMFVNNHTTLHARTAFSDVNRFMLRVRVK